MASFGEKVTPNFSLLYLPCVAQRGIPVYPHIRGGGEKGWIGTKRARNRLNHPALKSAGVCLTQDWKSIN